MRPKARCSFPNAKSNQTALLRPWQCFAVPPKRWSMSRVSTINDPDCWRKLERLERIVEFHRQAELSEQFNVSSRDTQGILASSAALKVLGVWNHHDWWAKLPDQDLTPAQKDELRWDVYQQWMMLNGMLVKTIGTKLFGNEQSGMIKRVFTGIRRLRTDAGKREASAALVVSDRIDLVPPIRDREVVPRHRQRSLESRRTTQWPTTRDAAQCFRRSETWRALHGCGDGPNLLPRVR